MNRPASIADLDALADMERHCFVSDRITRRQWRHMLTKAHADTLVAEEGEGVAGYVLLLYNQDTSVARLYSIAVASSARERGLGRRLVQAGEEAARGQGRAYMRLDVRRDNAASLTLFEGLGYRR